MTARLRRCCDTAAGRAAPPPPSRPWLIRSGAMSVALEARNITKVYGHVSALSGANFDVDAGEVVALIGDNGAGKSTLVKILSGTETPTSGEILIDGKPVTIAGPLAAREYGIETVYQDLALAPHLNPVQNMFLGREIMRPGIMGRLGFMDKTQMLAGSRKAFDELGATVRNFSGTVGAMSGGQKQAVAVARAAAWGKRVILLDEPTAASAWCRPRASWTSSAGCATVGSGWC